MEQKNIIFNNFIVVLFGNLGYLLYLCFRQLKQHFNIIKLVATVILH